MTKAKAIYVIIICIYFVIVLGGCTSEAKDKIDKNIEACESYYKAQNYNSAIESGKKAVRSSPKNTDSHYWLGSSYQAIGEQKLAIDELNKAEALANNKSDLASIASKLGHSYSDIGNRDEALVQYNRALLLHRELGNNANNIAGDLANIANEFSNNGQNEKALEYYQEALTYQPEGTKTSAIYSNIASIYIRQKKFDDAESLLRKAIDLDERNGDYHNQAIDLIRLGGVLRFKKDFKSAETALIDGLKKIQKVGDINWEGDAYRNLGWLYRDLGKKSQAAECYKKTLAIWNQIGNKKSIDAVQSDLDEISKVN